MNNVKRGFTLIELMIVVLVIGLLAAAGIPKYQSFVMEARKTTCLANIGNIDRCISVWETKTAPIPKTVNYILRFRPSANIANPAGQPAGFVINPGWSSVSPSVPMATDVVSIANEPKIFCCPDLANRMGGQEQVPVIGADTTQYVFTNGNQNLPPPWGYYNYRSMNQARQVTCTAFGYPGTQWYPAGPPVGGTRYQSLGTVKNDGVTPIAYNYQYVNQVYGPDMTREMLHAISTK